MKKILFYASHTLYYKVLIPVLIELINKGHQVSVLINKPNFYKYSPKKYSKRPTSNTCVNKSSIQFVANLIGYSAELNNVIDKIKFIFFIRSKEYDIAIGTTKNLDKLNRLKLSGITKVFAVGYEHMPVLLSLSTKLLKKNENILCNKIFLGDNDFSNKHNFKKYILNDSIIDHMFVNFTYLDKIKNMDYNKKFYKNNYVLIFHPGGYRNVVSKKGDNKLKCYNSQENFIRIVCEHILKNNLIPVIKIHPLFAQYHSKLDVTLIVNNLSIENNLYKNIIVTDAPYWDFAFNSKYILTFGSSGLYELYAKGIKNILICNFFGKERSEKFNMFDRIVINTIKDYNNLFKTEIGKNIINNKESLQTSIFEAYDSLKNNRSVDIIVNNII